MSDKHVRMTIEFDIDQESLDEHGISANDVFNHLVFREDDVADGFRISTDIPGMNPTSYFFLCSGKVVSQEFIPARSKGDGLDNWRRMVRDEIDTNPEVYDISSDDEKNALLDAKEIIDKLAESMEIRMQRGDLHEYDALEIVFQKDFPSILTEFRGQEGASAEQSAFTRSNSRGGLHEIVLEDGSESDVYGDELQTVRAIGTKNLSLERQIQSASTRATESHSSVSARMDNTRF